MIEPQGWSVARQQEDDRTLTLPSLRIALNISHRDNRIRLQELDVAASLQNLRSSTPRYAPPSAPTEWVSIKPSNDLRTPRIRPSLSSEWVQVKPNRTTQPCRLPSFGDAFGDMIQRADTLSLRSARSSIAESSSEWSYIGAPSPTSTATLYGSPAISPTTPSYNFAPTHTYPAAPAEPRAIPPYHEESALRLKRKTLRRVTSRATIHSFDPVSERTKQPRRPASNPNLKPTGGTTNKPRHFNQKYKDPDKLFIVYHKEDLKKTWPEILKQRLAMLPVILGRDYDAEVEEKRQVNGINGMFYRENDVMPLLTPDGSGLVFREKDGRWWECVQSQKCRVDEQQQHGETSSGGGSGGRRKGGGGGGGGLDARPRGMVERYPEEVLEYWDSHVRFFVPEERRLEVFERAKKYSQIRGEQRRQRGVPAWTLDNAEDRVLNLNPPKDTDKTDGNSNTPSAAKGRTVSRRRNKS